MKARAKNVERTNIEIDKTLMAQAMKATGERTKKGAVVAALETVVRLRGQVEAAKKLWGAGWEGDLDEMRQDRQFEKLR